MIIRLILCLCLVSMLFGQARAQLISENAPVGQWTQFEAAGYEHPVSGLVFTEQDKVCAGMPLGGLGTGCLDIETSGVLGFSSIFRPSMIVEPTPYQTLRNPQLFSPFLGISIGDDTWVMATQELLDGGEFIGCVDPVDPGNYTQNPTYMAHWRVNVPKTEDVRSVDSLRYWGHYPIVDIDYSSAAPVAVSLRAWSPFLPGDAQASAIPGAVFEVRLVNQSDDHQQGTLAFSFPGPVANERGSGDRVRRSAVSSERFHAVSVAVGPVDYAVAVLDEKNVRFGGSLSGGGKSWAQAATQLPKPDPSDTGISAAAAFSLRPGEKRAIRFVLAWRLSEWQGGAYNEIKHFDETWRENEFTLSRFARTDRTRYEPQYTLQYGSALEVVEQLSKEHESLLSRIVRWQQEVFAAEELPVWLRSALINNLALFAEDSLWAAPHGELSEWAAPLGAFQMTECPRTCAIVGCIASNYYGDLPIAYFFPELERQILRGYAAYVRPDGAVPFLYPPKDFTKAAYEWQIGLNGACFADLVHRLWLRTGDDSVVEEFYPIVKKNTEFTVNLASGEHGIISFHREGTGQEWWEHTPVFGMVTHLAGVRMAQLRFARAMALQASDKPFADQCEAWLQEASKLTEEYLWNEKTQSYDFFRYPAKKMHSTDIMSSQLDGQWMVDLHGLEPVFRPDRIDAALRTITTCLADVGMAGFAEPGKGPDLARYGTFPPEVNIVAMTYMYRGWRELGLEISRRNMDNIIRVQGLGWDMPNLIRCDDGRRTYGADYYQNMVLWGLPAALANQDLSGPCQPGGLVSRILQSAAK